MKTSKHSPKEKSVKACSLTAAEENQGFVSQMYTNKTATWKRGLNMSNKMYKVSWKKIKEYIVQNVS